MYNSPHISFDAFLASTLFINCLKLKQRTLEDDHYHTFGHHCIVIATTPTDIKMGVVLIKWTGLKIFARGGIITPLSKVCVRP